MKPYTVTDLRRSLEPLPDNAQVLIVPGEDDADADETGAQDIEGVRTLVWRDGTVVVYIHGVE